MVGCIFRYTSSVPGTEVPTSELKQGGQNLGRIVVLDTASRF
jgi:hypothetical protein